MEPLGINWGFLIFQFLIFGGWILLSLIALFALRRAQLTGISQALWVLLVIAIPVLGALAFFIVRPSEDNPRPQADEDRKV